MTVKSKPQVAEVLQMPVAGSITIAEEMMLFAAGDYVIVCNGEVSVVTSAKLNAQFFVPGAPKPKRKSTRRSLRPLRTEDVQQANGEQRV